VRNIEKEKEAGFWLIRGALLAERKKEEMKSAFSLMEEMEIDPIMLKAAVERMERVSGFDLGKGFDASMPYQEYEQIVDYMFDVGKERGMEIR
jgi:hypothetical protein